uniref:Uncharacterized protein n=1 Tax=Melanopsichium pennsylvanicum 4 TaxID=1398559 RepID=A0A077QUE5_9BASI|nr:uncharacterized protein BN887_06305 [Melanopsichium pennsylvanicum 4]
MTMHRPPLLLTPQDGFGRFSTNSMPSRLMQFVCRSYQMPT